MAPQGKSAVLQWSEKNGTVEKRFLSRKTGPRPSTVIVSRKAPPALKGRTPSNNPFPASAPVTRKKA